jgi:hypothetical protein
MFWRWWRIEEEDRPRVWLLYGWFSGLMCVGSVFGAVTWAAWMQTLVALFLIYAPGPSVTPAQAQPLHAQAQYWYAAFDLTYAIEFLCLSVAKLMVLDRMADFALAKVDGMSRRLAVWGRVVMAAVVVGNVVGLCANVAAAVYSQQSGDLYIAATASFTANNTDAGNNFNNEAYQKISVSSDAASVQMFCEVAVLLIIILAFSVVGIASARRVSSALRHMNDEHGAAGRQLRRQIVGTATFVFVTFLLRAAFSIMNALANALQNDGAACLTFCDTPCNNMYELIQNWILLTPEFQLIVVLISSPLALLVALWGMTSERMLQFMRFGRKQMTLVSLMRQGDAR